MAEDKTYQGAVRHLQDNNILEVGSTGTLDLWGVGSVQSGSTLTVKSGGSLDVAAGGALKIGGTQMTASAAALNAVGGLSGDATAIALSADNLATETINNAVSSSDGSTSRVALAQAGVTLLSCTGSTASANCLFYLPAPVAGAEKTLIAYKGVDATHTAEVEVNAKTVTIGYAAANHAVKLNALDEMVRLRGVSATKWIVISNEGSAVVSTNFTS